MNERIRELALQARLGPALMLHYWKNIDALTDSEQAELEQLEKFAELIVQECIQVSEAHAKDLESQPTDPLLEAYEDGVVNGIYEATVAIKEHFGVEQ